MSAFTTKNLSVANTAKVRAAFGRRLGHPGVDATDAEMTQQLNQFMIEVVQSYDDLDYAAAKPAPTTL
jgi:hypothetical protein